MEHLVRLPPVSAAVFYLIALAARLSGLVSTEAAFAIACVATALLIWADVRYMKGKPGVETWHVVSLAVAGTWTFIALMLVD